MDKKWMKSYVDCIENNDIDKAKKVLLENIPKKTMIYKYFKGLNRDINNLYKNKIWLSNVCSFNDPYDSAIMVDCGYKSQYPPEQREQAFKDYLKQEAENRKSNEERSCIFVTCFSEKNDSFPMWGYYAAGHRGICVGYDLRELINAYNCFPVIYSKKLINFKENDKDKDKKILLSSLTKSEEWKHEMEWRIVKRFEDEKGNKGILLDKFPSPLEIYVGCSQDDTIILNRNMINNGVDLSEQYASLDDIIKCVRKKDSNIYLSKIDINEYKLQQRKIQFRNMKTYII